MFSKSAKFYDAQYFWKKYAEETEQLVKLIRRHVPHAKTLLEVACGTGAHAQYLIEYGFEVEGLDLDPDLLKIANEKNPTTTFHLADMRNFDLGKKFDVVVSLFSAIGYADGVEGLNRTLVAIAGHLEPGGLVIIEPWFGPDQFISGRTHALFVDQPDIKLARMNVSRVEGRTSILDFKFMVAEDGQITTFEELHRLFMFTDDEYRAAFTQAGLSVELDPEGLIGRGLYIGRKT
jgi:SAM-dependent methyltransferase